MWNRPTLVFGLAAILVALDQATKLWALAALVSPGATVVLPGPIDLTLVYNRSNAFGLAPVAGALTRWGLTIFNVAVAVGLGAAIVRGKCRESTAIGFAFLIAGAIGNAIDRARLGAVIDFFDASKIGFIWVFNVADVAVDVGAAFLIFGWTFASRGDAPPRSSESS